MPNKSRVKAFTAEQVPRLLTAAERDPETHTPHRVVPILPALRRSEVIGLAMDAVDLRCRDTRGPPRRGGREHKPVLRERPKTDSSRRVIAMPPALVELLREQKARVLVMAIKWGSGYQREPMFLSPGLAGAPMDPQSLTHRMRQVMRRAKVVGPSPCHAWRHTSATDLLHSGQNLKTVQSRLGHSTPAITMALYVHPVEDRIARRPSISKLS